MRFQSLRFQIWIGLALLLAGLAVRLPLIHQSLWYDEMTTLAQYVLQPWSKILAAGAGDYIPNNHVLHTILAKLIYDANAVTPNEALLRMPALLAGLLVPFALAWPVRRDNPILALAIAAIAELHPWLVSFSVEARGYSLLLLLGVVATNCLLSRRVFYAISLTLAIYTVPLALLLIPAHAVAILLLQKSDFKKWLIAVGCVLLLSALLYLPMVHGLISYYKNPYPPTMTYRQFFDALPRYVFAGMRFPHNPDPLAQTTDPAWAAAIWAIPVIVLIIGSVIAWARMPLRPLLLTLGIVTLLGMLFPLLLVNTTEVRFVPWIMPWFCLTVVVLFFSIRLKTIPAIAFALLLAWQISQDINMPVNQPIREGLALADRIVPPDRQIMVLYRGARESVALYGNQVPHHDLLPAPDLHHMLAAQQLSLQQTGHLPWVIIFFEQIAHDRDKVEPGTIGLWTNLITHYHLACDRLPGRVSPVAIYAPT